MPHKVSIRVSVQLVAPLCHLDQVPFDFKIFLKFGKVELHFVCDRVKWVQNVQAFQAQWAGHVLLSILQDQHALTGIVVHTYRHDEGT